MKENRHRQIQNLNHVVVNKIIERNILNWIVLKR